MSGYYRHQRGGYQGGRRKKEKDFIERVAPFMGVGLAAVVVLAIVLKTEAGKGALEKVGLSGGGRPTKDDFLADPVGSAIKQVENIQSAEDVLYILLGVFLLSVVFDFLKDSLSSIVSMTRNFLDSIGFSRAASILDDRRQRETRERNKRMEQRAREKEGQPTEAELKEEAEASEREMEKARNAILEYFGEGRKIVTSPKDTVRSVDFLWALQSIRATIDLANNKSQPKGGRRILRNEDQKNDAVNRTSGSADMVKELVENKTILLPENLVRGYLRSAMQHSADLMGVDVDSLVSLALHMGERLDKTVKDSQQDLRQYEEDNAVYQRFKDAHENWAEYRIQNAKGFREAGLVGKLLVSPIGKPRLPNDFEHRHRLARETVGGIAGMSKSFRVKGLQYVVFEQPTRKEVDDLFAKFDLGRSLHGARKKLKGILTNYKLVREGMNKAGFKIPQFKEVDLTMSFIAPLGEAKKTRDDVLDMVTLTAAGQARVEGAK